MDALTFKSDQLDDVLVDGDYTDNKRILLTEKERNERRYQRLKTYRQRTKEKAVKYKGGKCEIDGCGYNKCIWALDFHHKDPNEKDFQFSKYSNHSWDRIKKEIDKCILVCSNCHREIHYNEYKKRCVSPHPDKVLKE